MLTEKQIQTYKKRLERERKHLLSRVKSPTPSVNPADERDTDEADIIVHIQTREQELWAKDELHQKLYEIEHALRRIAEGSYGQCESCGVEIDPDRLDFLPETTMCVRCREQAEKRAEYAVWMSQQRDEFEGEGAADEEETDESEEELVEEEEEDEELVLEDEDEE